MPPGHHGLDFDVQIPCSHAQIPVLRLRIVVQRVVPSVSSGAITVQLMGSQYYGLASETSDVDMAAAVPSDVAAEQTEGVCLEIGRAITLVTLFLFSFQLPGYVPWVGVGVARRW